MASVSVAAAVGEGFSLIRRQPAAVAIWAVILIVLLALRAAAYMPLYGAFMSTITQNIRSGSTAAPNIAAILPQLQEAQALGLLFNLVQLAVNAVLACAVFRAVLHPEQGRFGFLRFGGAELFLFIFYIGLFIVFIAGILVLAIPLAIVGALVGQSSAALGAAFAAIAVVAVLVGIVWLGLRLSMVGPMLVEEGQIRLGQAWALTRGQVGGLFLIGLLLVVLIIVAEIVVFGTAVGVLGAATGGFNPATLRNASPMDVLSRLSPVLAVFGLGVLALFAVLTPVFNAPWARAYKDLQQADVAATFS